MLRPAIGLALCAALSTASAQPAPVAPAPAAPASAPDTAAAPTSAPAAEPQAPSAAPEEREQLAAFLSQYVSFDDKTGEAYLGRTRQPLPRSQLYQVLGRPDLQQQHEARARTRTLLFVGAGAALAAGLGSGLYLHATLPDINHGLCASGAVWYNSPQCAPRHATQSAIGSGLIAAGAGAALALGLGALYFDTHPVPRAEVARMVGSYNGELRQRLRGEATASAPTTRLILAPVVGPQGPGLHASLTF